MPSLGLSNKLSASSPVIIPDYWVALDGTGDSLGFGTNFSSYIQAADFSMSGWINSSAISNHQVIFMTGGIGGGEANFKLYLQSSKLRVLSTSASETNLAVTPGSEEAALSSDTWYHVGFTYDDSETEAVTYINGSAYQTRDVSGDEGMATTSGDNAKIGEASVGPAYNFSGKIANFALFNDVVSAPEMSTLAVSQNADANAIGNCVGWWRMGGGSGDSGSTINDQTSGENDGTLAGDAAIVAGIF